MVTNIEIIRQNVFSHARVMVIGVSSDLKYQSRLMVCIPYSFPSYLQWVMFLSLVI